VKKYRYHIVNLDCANCAKRIEDELNHTEIYHHVVVNFSTSKISFEAEEVSLSELNRFVSKIEPGVVITSEEVKTSSEYHLSILILSLVLAGIGIFVTLPFCFNDIFIILAYVLLLYRPFMNAIKMLIKSRSINENALITISCVGAYLVGEHTEGLMVVTLYTIGKILEERAIHNSRKSIKDLLDIKQDYANLKTDTGVVEIEVEDIKIDDILVIKKGEKIPTDGIVVCGSTRLDTSSLTGESKLMKTNVDDEVLSGSINVGDVIEIKATSLFSDSTISRILQLVEEATDKKANTETLVSKISKIYTPVVLILAILVAVVLPFISSVSYQESIYRGLTFLVIACPCAIAISVPLSYFTGIGTSSKCGILVKGSNYLDNLSHVNKIIFDKTGTLTTGTFHITDIEVTSDRYRKDEIITMLVKGESFSNHPIAKSIMNLTSNQVDNSDVKNYQEVEGEGISYNIGKKRIKVGSSKLCDCGYDTDIHVNINGQHVASVTIDDGIKEEAKGTIENLKKKGITTYMFTGDKKEIASEIGNVLEIDHIHSEMLPTDKYKEYESVVQNGDVVVFVGDGVNDAPVLKRADIGISMGQIGSSSAIEASDITLISDDLSKIPLAIDISKYTNFIIKQNLVFAISVKVIILMLSIFGLASMWFAVFADTGVTVLTILNTLRIMRKFKK